MSEYQSAEYQRFQAAMGVKPVKTHYHVGSNTPGYLPEGDVYTVTSKREAISAVAEEARRYRDEEYDLPRSQRRVGRGSARDGGVYFERPGDPYDLGIHFWWAVCDVPDCPEDDAY